MNRKDRRSYGCKGMCHQMDRGERFSNGRDRYERGAKRCSVCEQWWYPPIAEALIRCKCCYMRLRYRSKHKNSRKILAEKKRIG